MKNTKRALLTSVLALVLCFSMLLGSTFAWFTDSAVSANNKINAGTLDVDLYQWTAADASVEITNESTPLFSGDLIWEPGKTEVVYLSIKNNGNLALKYRVTLVVKAVTLHELTDVMVYAIDNDATYGTVTAWDANKAVTVGKGTNDTQAEDVTLLPGDEHFFALSVHMLESATNEYMGESITFDVQVLAGQLASESDSFGSDYDEYAEYPAVATIPALAANETARDVTIRGNDGYQVGAIRIPKDATDPAATEHKVVIEETYYEGNFTVASGLETVQYDISVSGLKENNNTNLTVQLRLPAGLDPNTVKVYHYSTPVACDYNPNNGYVTFETTSFSPFTVVYDAESEYVAPPVTEDMDIPTAKVVYSSEFVNTTIAWGQYGSWSPTTGLDSNLEAAFTFSCPDNLPADVLAAFQYWYCDFYVSLDRDLGPNQIFLGGNYGDFGWVGFHNGELTLKANEEIALLGSVTANPWTYYDVMTYVGTFICGVGDVNNALEGATFTVKLRLTNPENENEYYDVNVVSYTFGGDYTITNYTK